ncbi:ubiquitin, partial [Lactobacillus delbrueckii subsp. bulgaricus]|nr:ubiquitin [Lactobacillus delbrueckii subsp. bulgaricus]
MRRLIPFLPLLVDAIFKINIRTSIMNITMQWSLWL